MGCRIILAALIPFAQAGLVPIPAPETAASGSHWFRLAADSPCFDGHFQGAPILPGVAHFALALTALARGSDSRVLAGVRDVRFTRPLGPGDQVEVILAEGREPHSVRFEIRRDGLPTSG